MDLVALGTFVAVADAASFSRAADQLHLAQPAVSQQVKRLERDLGAELFHRSTRRVALTPAGAELLPRARAILAEVERARDEVRLVEAGMAGRVTIGFVGTATYELLPTVARSVRDRLPGVELELYGEQLSPSLEADLRAGRLDAAVLRDPDPASELSVRPLRRERLVAVLPSDHPAARRSQVKLASLKDSAFVTHPSGHRSVMYAAVMQACRKAGFSPGEVLEVRETATLVAFVAAGMGVALVPEPVRALAVPGVAYRRISDVEQVTELALATSSEDVSATVGSVLDVVHDVAGAAGSSPE